MGLDTRKQWLQEIGPALTSLLYELERVQASTLPRIEETRRSISNTLDHIARGSRQHDFLFLHIFQENEERIEREVKRLSSSKYEVERASAVLNNTLHDINRILSEIEALLDE